MIIYYPNSFKKALCVNLQKINSPYTHLTEFLEQSLQLSLLLPKTLQLAVAQFKRAGNQASYLMIKNLPIEPQLPPTPHNTTLAPKSSFYSEALLAAIGFLLGEPYGYLQESEGALIHNLFPIAKHQSEQVSTSSRVTLEFHTEIIFHPFAPDFLILLCLRADPHNQAKTFVSSLRIIMQQQLLSATEIAILRQPLYKTGIDYSFGNAATIKANGPVMPCLYGDMQDPLLAFDVDLMKGLTPAANLALAALKQALEAVTMTITLQVADLIIIDNRRATHGRSSFKAYFDGNDRWLQRCIVTRNLQQAEILFAKKERIISFSDFANVTKINHGLYA